MNVINPTSLIALSRLFAVSYGKPALIGIPDFVVRTRRRITGGEAADGRQVKARAGFSRERIEEEIRQGETVPMWKVLRCRVRYFTDGAVLGSKAFVDGFFERERSRFGPKRTSGARKMRGGDWGGVTSLRELADGVG